MSYDDERLESFTIELADTRPQMLSIPYMGFLGEVPFMLGVLLLVGFGFGVLNFFWRGALWFFPVWFIIGKAIAFDYHFLTKLQLWQRYTMPTLDAHKWNGITVTPFPTITKLKKGIIDDAI